MTEALIRRAGSADVAVLAELGRLTFTQTFAHLYPPEDLAYFLRTSHADDKLAREIEDPANGHWIVEQDGEAIGYAWAGPCDLPHPDVTPDCGELKRIYLRKDRQGSGAGSRLLATALDWLEKDGPRTLWIGVWSENYGAQRLYGRHGFAKVGEYKFQVGQTQDHEFILRRKAS